MAGISGLRISIQEDQTILYSSRGRERHLSRDGLIETLNNRLTKGYLNQADIKQIAKLDTIDIQGNPIDQKERLSAYSKIPSVLETILAYVNGKTRQVEKSDLSFLLISYVSSTGVQQEKALQALRGFFASQSHPPTQPRRVEESIPLEPRPKIVDARAKLPHAVAGTSSLNESAAGSMDKLKTIISQQLSTVYKRELVDRVTTGIINFLQTANSELLGKLMHLDGNDPRWPRIVETLDNATLTQDEKLIGRSLKKLESLLAEPIITETERLPVGQATVKPTVPYCKNFQPMVSDYFSKFSGHENYEELRINYFMTKMFYESSCNPGAVSRVGAMGLKQIMPDTARSLVNGGADSLTGKRLPGILDPQFRPIVDSLPEVVKANLQEIAKGNLGNRLLDPETSIVLGIWYDLTQGRSIVEFAEKKFGIHLSEEDRIRIYCSVYNSGPNRTLKVIRQAGNMAEFVRASYRETRDYMERIVSAYSRYDDPVGAVVVAQQKVVASGVKLADKSPGYFSKGPFITDQLF